MKRRILLFLFVMMAMHTVAQNKTVAPVYQYCFEDELCKYVYFHHPGQFYFNLLYKLNQGGNFIDTIFILSSDYSVGILKNQTKLNCTYLKNGQPGKIYNYLFNKTNNNWIFEDSYEFTYDKMKFQSVERLHYYWFGHDYCGENELQEVWHYPNDNRYKNMVYTTYCRVENQCTPQLETQVEFVYNANKSLRERIFIWSPNLEYGSYWISSYFYDYDTNGLLSYITYYNYYNRDSLKLDKRAKIFLRYNEKDLLTTSYTYIIFNMGKDSILSGRDTFKYNENDLLIENIGYYWDTTFGWIKNYKSSMSYNEINCMSDSIFYIWDNKSNKWAEEEKYIFYTSKNNQSSLIKENIKADELIIYPNPVKDKLFIETTEKYSRIMIYGIDGKIVSELNYPSPSSEINLEKLPPGLYLLRIFDDKGIITRKFLKE